MEINLPTVFLRPKYILLSNQSCCGALKEEKRNLEKSIEEYKGAHKKDLATIESLFNRESLTYDERMEGLEASERTMERLLDELYEKEDWVR